MILARFRWFRVLFRPHRRVYLKFTGKPWSLDLIWTGRLGENERLNGWRVLRYCAKRHAVDLERTMMYGSSVPPNAYRGLGVSVETVTRYADGSEVVTSL